jgi:hypothetical protein
MIRELIKKLVPYRFRRLHYWVEESLRRKTGLVVSKGPFKGLEYLAEAVDRFSWPRILGTYEQELHDRISALCDRGFAGIVNIGAAEGYYTVGFLLASPASRVVAFETEIEFQKTIRRLAELNNVDNRLEVKGFCNADSLRESLQAEGKTLVFIDVEGCEREILDPGKVPELKTAHIVVETHDFKDATITNDLKKRFAESHSIETVYSQWRTMKDFPLPLSLVERTVFKRMYLDAMFEGRGEIMHWLCMTPR